MAVESPKPETRRKLRRALGPVCVICLLGVVIGLVAQLLAVGLSIVVGFTLIAVIAAFAAGYRWG